MTITNPYRITGWALLATLLVLPAIAMRFTTQVDWSPFDFVAAAAMLGLLGVGGELLLRRPGGWYRGGMALALVTAFLLVWVNLAVGIIGSERNEANLLFAGVLAVATGGACLARLEAGGMARAMLATASAQVLVAGIALAGGSGSDGPIWPRDLIGATALFATLWLAAALMFRRAAR